MSENYYLLDDMQMYNKGFNRKQWENVPENICKIEFKKYYADKLPIDLLTWCRVNEPEDKMLWKEGYWEQIMFIRDTIMDLLSDSYEEFKSNPVLVISTHRSKSIVLPVYQINYKGIKMIIRNNFYDWKVTVDSKVQLNFDMMSLFNIKKRINSTLCEGFKYNQVFDSYENNKNKFTFEIEDQYKLYTFMYLLKNYINNSQ